MQIIDGKATSLAIQDEIKEEVQRQVAAGAKKPHLAAIIVGDNPASRAYVGHKIKACERVGFDSTLVELSENILEVRSCRMGNISTWIYAWNRRMVLRLKRYNFA